MLTPSPGPGLFRAKTADLGTLEKKLDESNKLLKGAGGDLGKLQSGLGTAGTGAVQLQAGLSEAASGREPARGRRHQGAGRRAPARGGALRRTRRARRRSRRDLTRLCQARTTLKDGSGKALAGAALIAGGAGTAAEKVTAGLPIVKQMATDVGTRKPGGPERRRERGAAERTAPIGAVGPELDDCGQERPRLSRTLRRRLPLPSSRRAPSARRSAACSSRC